MQNTVISMSVGLSFCVFVSLQIAHVQTSTKFFVHVVTSSFATSYRQTQIETHIKK